MCNCGCRDKKEMRTWKSGNAGREDDCITFPYFRFLNIYVCFRSYYPSKQSVHMLPLGLSPYASGIPSICLHIYSISSVPYLWSQVKDRTWL